MLSLMEGNDWCVITTTEEEEGEVGEEEGAFEFILPCGGWSNWRDVIPPKSEVILTVTL